MSFRRPGAWFRGAAATAVLLAACCTACRDAGPDPATGSDGAAGPTGAPALATGVDDASAAGDAGRGPDAKSAATEAGTAGEAASAGRYLSAEAVVERVEVFAQPAEGAVALTLANPNPEGAPLVFSVFDASGSWLRVQLPVRPNGSTGWVRQADVALVRHGYRIEVRLAERTLTVFEDDDVVAVEPIGVGKDPTPTPGGSFYLYELLRPADPTGPYGPYAFGLSGFSEALQSFAGGDGRLGIHGTNDPSSLGSDSTSGCIRLANPAIEQLAQTVPLGTPVIVLV